MSKLFSGDFYSLIFELTRLILALFVCRAPPFPAGARAPVCSGSLVCQSVKNWGYDTITKPNKKGLNG